MASDLLVDMIQTAGLASSEVHDILSRPINLANSQAQNNNLLINIAGFTAPKEVLLDQGSLTRGIIDANTPFVEIARSNPLEITKVVAGKSYKAGGTDFIQVFNEFVPTVCGDILTVSTPHELNKSIHDGLSNQTAISAFVPSVNEYLKSTQGYRLVCSHYGQEVAPEIFDSLNHESNYDCIKAYKRTLEATSGDSGKKTLKVDYNVARDVLVSELTKKYGAPVTGYREKSVGEFFAGMSYKEYMALSPVDRTLVENAANVFYGYSVGGHKYLALNQHSDDLLVEAGSKFDTVHILPIVHEDGRTVFKRALDIMEIAGSDPNTVPDKHLLPFKEQALQAVCGGTSAVFQKNIKAFQFEKEPITVEPALAFDFDTKLFDKCGIKYETESSTSFLGRKLSLKVAGDIMPVAGSEALSKYIKEKFGGGKVAFYDIVEEPSEIKASLTALDVKAGLKIKVVEKDILQVAGQTEGINNAELKSLEAPALSYDNIVSAFAASCGGKTDMEIAKTLPSEIIRATVIARETARGLCAAHEVYKTPDLNKQAGGFVDLLSMSSNGNDGPEQSFSAISKPSISKLDFLTLPVGVYKTGPTDENNTMCMDSSMETVGRMLGAFNAILNALNNHEAIARIPALESDLKQYGVRSAVFLASILAYRLSGNLNKETRDKCLEYLRKPAGGHAQESDGPDSSIFDQIRDTLFDSACLCEMKLYVVKWPGLLKKDGKLPSGSFFRFNDDEPYVSPLFPKELSKNEVVRFLNKSIEGKHALEQFVWEGPRIVRLQLNASAGSLKATSGSMPYPTMAQTGALGVADSRLSIETTSGSSFETALGDSPAFESDSYKKMRNIVLLNSAVQDAKLFASKYGFQFHEPTSLRDLKSQVDSFAQGAANKGNDAVALVGHIKKHILQVMQYFQQSGMDVNTSRTELYKKYITDAKNDCPGSSDSDPVSFDAYVSAILDDHEQVRAVKIGVNAAIQDINKLNIQNFNLFLKQTHEELSRKMLQMKTGKSGQLVAGSSSAETFTEQSLLSYIDQRSKLVGLLHSAGASELEKNERFAHDIGEVYPDLKKGDDDLDTQYSKKISPYRLALVTARLPSADASRLFIQVQKLKNRQFREYYNLMITELYKGKDFGRNDDGAVGGDIKGLAKMLQTKEFLRYEKMEKAGVSLSSDEDGVLKPFLDDKIGSYEEWVNKHPPSLYEKEVQGKWKSDEKARANIVLDRVDYPFFEKPEKYQEQVERLYANAASVVSRSMPGSSGSSSSTSQAPSGPGYSPYKSYEGKPPASDEERIISSLYRADKEREHQDGEHIFDLVCVKELAVRCYLYGNKLDILQDSGNVLIHYNLAESKDRVDANRLCVERVLKYKFMFSKQKVDEITKTVKNDNCYINIHDSGVPHLLNSLHTDGHNTINPTPCGLVGYTNNHWGTFPVVMVYILDALVRGNMNNIKATVNGLGSGFLSMFDSMLALYRGKIGLNYSRMSPEVKNMLHRQWLKQYKQTVSTLIFVDFYNVLGKIRTMQSNTSTVDYRKLDNYLGAIQALPMDHIMDVLASKLSSMQQLDEFKTANTTLPICPTSSMHYLVSSLKQSFADHPEVINGFLMILLNNELLDLMIGVYTVAYKAALYKQIRFDVSKVCEIITQKQMFLGCISKELAMLDYVLSKEDDDKLIKYPEWKQFLPFTEWSGDIVHLHDAVVLPNNDYKLSHRGLQGTAAQNGAIYSGKQVDKLVKLGLKEYHSTLFI